MIPVYKRKKSRQESLNRITILIIVIFIFAGLIAFRLFDLQVVHFSVYKTMASDIHDFYQDLSPRRGKIFVHNHSLFLENGKEQSYPIATDIELNLVYAVPKFIENPEEVAKKLSPVLEISEEDLLKRLSKENDLYEPLKHYLDDGKKEEIKNMEIKGIDFLPETKRYYPEKNLFSHVLGFVGFEGDKILGRYGIEEKFEKELAGEKGLIKSERGAFGQWIAFSPQKIKKAQNGANIILTLDYPIQYFVCSKLKWAVDYYGAEGGTAIVMEPQTGKILAMCSQPDFDPNLYNKVKNINLFINPAISKVFEPGSVFKAFTMAAGLETGKISPESTYEDKGEVKIGGYTIKNSDFKAHGKKTMTEVLEESLNTGAVFVVQKVGRDNFRKYVQNFGFGSLTSIELPNEVSGDISSLNKKKEIYSATASFGQGISVVPLQLVSAFGAIANQGKLMKPYIVDKIVYPDGREIKTEPKFVRQSISPVAANILKGMLVSVIENGYGKRAKVKGYYVAGKTGTAQVPDPKKRGYSDKTIHTFVGFAPADDPKFVGLVKLDNPRGVRFAASSACPTFGQIARFLLNYLEVPSEE